MAETLARKASPRLLATLPCPNSYRPHIQSWLKVLRDDKRAIFSAAAHVQRAADFLHGLQPVIEEPQQQDGVAA